MDAPSSWLNGWGTHVDNPYLSASAVFLIKTAFDLFIGAVLLRFLLQWVRADFRNPVSQFLMKVTNPVLIPLRRVIPGVGGVDISAVIVIAALQIIKMLLLHVIAAQTMSVAGLLVLSLADFIELLLGLYTITLILEVILSWVGPQTRNPLSGPLHALNNPLLSPIRRVMPTIAGLDLSPIVALIIFQLLKILVVAPLTDIGRGLG